MQQASSRKYMTWDPVAYKAMGKATSRSAFRKAGFRFTPFNRKEKEDLRSKIFWQEPL
jgi:hypothetical protein